MRRRWLHGLLIPIWALWFAFAITEPYALDNCPMQVPASAAHGLMVAQVGMSGMHHAAMPGSHLPKSTRCCTLGDCGLSPMATLPQHSDITVSCAVASTIASQTFRSNNVPAPPHPDLRLPFSHAPPLLPIA